jgi:hypothetical protein
MKIKFGKVAENITTRKEFTLAKALKVLKGKTIAVLGYGIQGPGQALNMRDNGFDVIIGQRKNTKANSSWNRAKKDGWVEGKTLFSLEEAAEKGDIIMLLTSDGSVGEVWKKIEKFVTKGKALYLSHGFAYVYNKLTGVKPGKDVDVIMVAPKGSGTNVRRNFLNGAGINSSFAVAQDATGKALELAIKDRLGCKVRSVELNLPQRCAAHIASQCDIEESFGVGQAAVSAAVQGVSREMMVILRDCEEKEEYSSVFGHMDIDLIANKTKYVPKHYINERGNQVTDECLRYILPLIKGECYPEYENGLPVFFSF